MRTPEVDSGQITEKRKISGEIVVFSEENKTAFAALIFDWLPELDLNQRPAD